jgi:hypothetical protein
MSASEFALGRVIVLLYCEKVKERSASGRQIVLCVWAFCLKLLTYILCILQGRFKQLHLFGSLIDNNERSRRLVLAVADYLVRQVSVMPVVEGMCDHDDRVVFEFGSFELG